METADDGATIAAAAAAAEWRQGDWLVSLAGDGPLTGDVRDRAVRLTGIDAPDLTLILKVCRAFPADRRHAALSFDHHEAVLSLVEADRPDMLTRAAGGGWSAKQTRKAVLEYRVAAGDYSPPHDDDPEDKLYRAAAQACNRANPAVRRMLVEALEDADFGVIEL